MYESNNNNQYPNYYGSYSGNMDASSQNVSMSPANPIPPEPKKQKEKGGIFKKVAGMALSGVVFGLCAGSIIVIMLHLAPGETAQEKSESMSITENTNHAVADQDIVKEAEEIATANISGDTVVSDVSQVVENTMPSVVSITGMYKVEEDNYFGFHNFRTESESPGSGSGIIVGQNDTELLIATNNHVVEDATSLAVQFIDDTTADAVVKGTNADVDLAVIAIPLENISRETREAIKVASLGNSDVLKVGEPAIAIGNALGYGQSVTTGVISATNREYTIEENTACLIQTDAAINPGNSGGALLNARGEVIGINSSKIGGSVIEGMGYAIPISTAKPIIEELMTKTTRTKVEEAQKAYLGIVGISVTSEVQEAYGLPEGVYVTQVFSGTGAANAGLVKGDIIVEFDGEKVRTMEELTSLLECYEKGSTVEIKIMQGSPSGYQENTVTVTLGGRVDS
ncbi:MAG: PDZ domain-containing protein [Lachnospiraceae bacterium]|nr:PDZ domain-containing protein [Lachnospiraceae bacterium]